MTRAENVRRGIPTPGGGGAGQAKKTHCKYGHPYDSVNTYYMSTGWRDCRTCKKAASRRSYERKLLRLRQAVSA